MSKDLHVPGAKDDSGKNRMALVLGAFAPAMMLVSKVGTFGANKYTDNGWQTVPQGVARYEDAMLRHYFHYKDGETVDPESGLHHLAHCAWNALAVLTLTLKGNLNASTNCSGQSESTGKADNDVRAGVSQIHPRGVDDSPNVFKEWSKQQSRTNQEIHGSITSAAVAFWEKQARDVEYAEALSNARRNLESIMVEQRVRGSISDFTSDKARLAQAVGQSSSGMATEYQGCRNSDGVEQLLQPSPGQ